MTVKQKAIIDWLAEKLGIRMAKQVICLILLAFNVPRKEIMAALNVCPNSLVKYGKALESGDLSIILRPALYKPASELDKYADEIEKAIEERKPQSRREIQDIIKEITGLNRSLNRIGSWLKKRGLKNRAVGFMPAKADKAKQENFRDTVLLPLIDKAKRGLCELYFLDASHFVMGAFAGRIWGRFRVWVKTGSGRKRFNVLGALNFVTKKMETVTNSTYITSTEIVSMLQKLSELHAGRIINIILDNARYQKCQLVFDAAAKYNINLVFLPTYSPNLNLIERVWKFVKSKVLNAAYKETFEQFCNNIAECTDNLHEDFHDEMASLITEKFQILGC